MNDLFYSNWNCYSHLDGVLIINVIGNFINAINFTTLQYIFGCGSVEVKKCDFPSDLHIPFPGLPCNVAYHYHLSPQ